MGKKIWVVDDSSSKSNYFMGKAIAIRYLLMTVRMNSLNVNFSQCQFRFPVDARLPIGIKTGGNLGKDHFVHP